MIESAYLNGIIQKEKRKKKYLSILLPIPEYIPNRTRVGSCLACQAVVLSRS